MSADADHGAGLALGGGGGGRALTRGSLRTTTPYSALPRAPGSRELSPGGSTAEVPCAKPEKVSDCLELFGDSKTVKLFL